VNGHAKARLTAGLTVITVNPGGVSVPAADMLARLGADCLFIDCERTAISVDAVPAMARAAQAGGISAIVRSESRDPAILTRYLDCGIDGLVLPQVESAEECAMLVSTARAATKGREGDLLLIAQIESVGGIAALDAIATAPGIDVVLLGPNDLAHSMGFLGDTARPELRQAVETCATRLIAHGKPFGLPVTAGTIADWRHKGARFFYTSLEGLLAPALADLRTAIA
jgi:4-hydroxy-2-oxoheptanedioate aldolase